MILVLRLSSVSNPSTGFELSHHAEYSFRRPYSEKEPHYSVSLAETGLLHRLSTDRISAQRSPKRANSIFHGRLFLARRRPRPCFPYSSVRVRSSRMGRTVSSLSQIVGREFLSPHSPVRLKRKLARAWPVRRCFRLR